MGTLEICGGYALSAETIAAGWGGMQVQAWPGRTQRRHVSSAIAACAVAGLDGPDLEAWLWCMGHEDAGLYGRVRAQLMREAREVREHWAGRIWTDAAMDGLVRLALAEARSGAIWKDVERRRWLRREQDMDVAQSSWSEWWLKRYGAIQQRLHRRVKRARVAMSQARQQAIENSEASA